MSICSGLTINRMTKTTLSTLIRVSDVLSHVNNHGKTAYDYYINNKKLQGMLDETELAMLKGESVGNIKSAAKKCLLISHLE